MVENIDEAKQVLYRQAPQNFVAARDTLARETRLVGDRELAKAIKGLRKPSVIAATLNGVIHQDADGVTNVLEAVERLRAGQASMLGGETVDFAELQRAFRDAVASLAAHAETQQLEVRAAIEAAAIDPAHHAALVTGTFAVPPAPDAGFGFGFGELPPGLVPKARPARKVKASRRTTPHADASKPKGASKQPPELRSVPDPGAVREARQAARAAARAATKAEQSAAAAARAVAKIDDEVASLEAALTSATGRRETASRRAAELRADAERLEREAATARNRADELEGGP